MIRFFLALAIALCVTSCANVQQTGRVDQTQKTITVPPGSAMAPIKSALKQDGWVVKVKNVTNYGAGAAYQTRYAMEADFNFFDYSITLERMYHYDISVQDVKTNEEVLTMSGTGTPRGIGSKLVQSLRR